ncbi:HMG1/2-like protein [Tanacetum coccineum]
MRGPKVTAVVAQKKLITEYISSSHRLTVPVKKITKAKVKKEKDPGAPKRPPSAFFVFMDEFRKEFKENFPDNKSVAVVAKEGGAKWKAMSDSEKAPFVEKAATKKAEYGIALKLHNVELAEAKEKSASTSKSSSEVHDDVEDVASSQVAFSLTQKCHTYRFYYDVCALDALLEESIEADLVE